MKTLLLCAVFATLCSSAALAVEVEFGGFGDGTPDRTVPCLSEAQRARIQARIAATGSALRAAGRLAAPEATQTVLFGWPLRPRSGFQDSGYHGISGFVDHAAAYPNILQDHNCGTRTYDLADGYNHAGTDLFTWPFYWHKMDHDEVEVVAAAPGQIVGKDDGNYDRNCGFGAGNWNAVYIVHADGSAAWYGHMKNGSPTAKEVGATVLAGEYLGVVGSSGSSTGPHLHFEVYSNQGQLVDPWAGPCNAGLGDSWWAAQRPYYDSAVNALLTHSAPPVFPACPGTETINARDTFVPGQRAYFAAYYRDQLAGQETQYAVFDAAGGEVASWSHASSEPHYAASYWYWYFNVPAGPPLGMWKFQAVFQGVTYAHHFWVVPVTGVDGDAGASGRLALTVASASPSRGAFSFEYRLPAAGRARLEVFDVAGRRVARLVDDDLEAGSHRASWETGLAGGGAARGGLYFVRLAAGGRSALCRVAVVD